MLLPLHPDYTLNPDSRHLVRAPKQGLVSRGWAGGEGGSGRGKALQGCLKHVT